MRIRSFLLIKIPALFLIICMLLPSAFSFTPENPSDALSELPAPYEMQLIGNGLIAAYQSYYSDTVRPDYLAGFSCNADGTMVMYLTDVSESVLEEVKTAFHGDESWSDKSAWIDQWLPTVSFQEVKYSRNQLKHLESVLKETLRFPNDCIRRDPKHNCVVFFYHSEKELAAVNKFVEDENIASDILSIFPIEQYDAWHESVYAEISPDGAVSSTDKLPTDERSGNIMPGMKNTFYNANHSACSGTVGFTATITFEGSNHNSFDFYPGESVDVFFFMGITFPFAIRSAQYRTVCLLPSSLNATAPVWITVSIDSTRMIPAEYQENVLAPYITSAITVPMKRTLKIFLNTVTTSISTELHHLKKPVHPTILMWTAVSSPGQIVMRFRFPVTAVAQSTRIFFRWCTASDAHCYCVYQSFNTGGEGQTIYSIINDLENYTDFSFDSLCTY